MGDKSVNRLRAITLTSQAESTAVQGRLKVKQCENTEHPSQKGVMEK